MQSCVVVGGGVVGLSIAYELARRSWRVTVLDKGPLASEASWAGAGILPPANAETALHPIDKLRALSHRLHEEWAERLLAETGIDNGFRRCGGIYLARTPGETASLVAMAMTLEEERIQCESLSPDELIRLEPGLERLATAGQLKSAWRLPGECQIRNPRHLQALIVACRKLGVEFTEQTEVTDYVATSDRISLLQTTRGEVSGDAIVFAAGPWTQRLLAQHDIPTGIFPVRGQIVLFRCAQPPFRHVLNEGPRYLVPREDGHVLVGSTEEEVGFNNSTTAEGIAELTQFALDLVPALARGQVERTWAGLRPASFDGFPYLGRLPNLQNAYLAAGHFRSGLHLSPGTAVLLADLMCGKQPEIDLTPFRVARG